MKVGETMGHAWGGPGRYLGSFDHGGERLVAVAARFDGGALAVLLQTEAGEAWAKLSVNVGRQDGFEFVVHHDATDFAAALLKASHGLFVDTGRRVSYGFVSDAPVWRLGDAAVGGMLADAL